MTWIATVTELPWDAFLCKSALEHCPLLLWQYLSWLNDVLQAASLRCCLFWYWHFFSDVNTIALCVVQQRPFWCILWIVWCDWSCLDPFLFACLFSAPSKFGPCWLIQLVVPFFSNPGHPRFNPKTIRHFLYGFIDVPAFGTCCFMWLSAWRVN